MSDSDRIVITLADPNDTTRKTETASMVCRECGGLAERDMPSGGPLPPYCCAEPGRWWWCARLGIVARKV